ncbi:MAG: hypothetical protein US60_C0029G0007 [Microgenomates group bacterium GW2011_GWC1_37_8]|nr:MAG: hypothetical protein US60_C0029G0007 [Microgenomates group bacterium GW2011_GWC1_37_8]KKQ85985.1 MAG: hypothetical protein UT08_C0002G0007 [Candidatus Woesebacteria bacterium GW2011_GWB1_38_8]
MQKVRYRLIGNYCMNCKKISYPAKSFCPSCRKSDSLKSHVLSPLGKIFSWSLLYVAPEGFEQLIPYPIALVKMDDGPIILSQITDYDLKDLKSGSRVEAVFRKLVEPNGESIIRYGLKFRPVGT